MPRHSWTVDDDLIAYHVFRFGPRDIDGTIQEIGEILGMGFNSFNLKLANFKAIAGLGGLENYTRQSVQVYEKYSKLSDSEARLAGVEAIGRAFEAHSIR
ncbi:MAG: hypothetical protein ACRYFS_11795 [Janthinobacterium lividum]